MTALKKRGPEAGVLESASYEPYQSAWLRRLRYKLEGRPAPQLDQLGALRLKGFKPVHQFL